MIRKALLIGALGKDLPGVTKDIANFKDFLLSDAGGAWASREIETLIDPSRILVNSKLSTLSLSDYSFVFFAGHGRHHVERNMTQLQLQTNVHIEVSDLIRAGASKHSVVVDACRVLHSQMAMDSLTERMTKAASQFSISNSRELFDSHLKKCSPGVVELYACDLTETAGEDSALGGLYTSSLIGAGKDWFARSPSGQVLSIKQAHEFGSIKVKRVSNNRQNPVAAYPRSLLHFPFAVK
jgi:hypothetical protein